MRTMILAAIAALSLGFGAANAQSFAHGSAPQQGNGYNYTQGGGE